MQLCSKEMQGVTSILPLQELHAHNNHTQQTQQQHLIPNSHLQPPPASQFDSPNSHDVFLDQVLGSFQASWSEGQKQLCNGSLMTNSQSQPDGSSLYADGLGHHGNLYDETTLLASRLRQHQISPSLPAPDTKPLSLQQQILMQRAGLGRPVSPAAGGSPLGYHELPLGQNSGGENKVESLCKGPTPSRCLPRAAYTSTNQQQHFQQFQAGMNDAPAGGAAAGAPKQKVRARRGQATDPHSIAERLRRERIAERMKALQELVPIANKPDKATMLDEIIEYVKFLRLQVKVLSMSRIGYPAAVAPLLADIPPSEAASGLTQQTASTNESMTGTEDKVAKLMEEDVGSAMQYLQGKGLCLMPISLASLISPSGAAYSSGRLLASAGDSPSSPSMSVLSVQSAVANGGADT